MGRAFDKISAGLKDAIAFAKGDNDPDRFKERLGKLVKHKPVEKPE